MGKVPVWRTIGEAFGFAFERYPAIFGVVWLPLLLLGVCEYFTFRPLFEALPVIAMHAAQHPQDPDAMREFMGAERFVPALNLLTYLVTAWIAVGVTKEALRLRSGPRFVYLAVGMDELLVLAAYLVALALFVAFAIAISLIALLIFGIGAIVVHSGAPDVTALKPWTIGGAVAFGVAVLCAMIYFAVRLLTFIVPVTVAEKRFGLMRSWELSKGNFWRLFAIGLVIFLLLLVMELVVFVVVGLAGLFSAIGSLSHLHADGIAAAGPFFKKLEAYLPILGLVLLAISPILYGLQIGPWAFAYRALVPETAPAAVEPAP